MKAEQPFDWGGAEERRPAAASRRKPAREDDAPVQSYLDLVEPLFQYVCKVNRGAKSISPVTADLAIVRGDIENILQKIAAKANRDVALSRLHAKMEKPLVYYVDSIIAQSNLTIAGEWHQQRLASIRWGDKAGDENFFNLLNTELESPSESSEQALAVYYLCLCLGFTGMYVNKPDVISGLISRIAPRLRGLMESDLNARVCEEAYAVARPLPPPVGSRIGIFVLIFVFVILSVFISYYCLYVGATEDLRKAVGEVIQHSNP
jgi:type IV/VI secretion system ImpK/VasF family protein